MSFNNHDKDDPNGKRYSKSQQVKDSSSVQLPSDTDLAAMAKFKSNEEVIAIINNAQSIQWLQHPAPDEYWYPNSSIVTFKQQGYIAGYRDATPRSLSDKEEIERLRAVLQSIADATDGQNPTHAQFYFTATQALEKR